MSISPSMGYHGGVVVVVQSGSGPQNEIYSFTWTTAPTQGIFTITANSVTSGAIGYTEWHDDPTLIQAVMDGLVGSDNSIVTSITNGYQIEFTGTLQDQTVTFSVDPSGTGTAATSTITLGSNVIGGNYELDYSTTQAGPITLIVPFDADGAAVTGLINSLVNPLPITATGSGGTGGTITLTANAEGPFHFLFNGVYPTAANHDLIVTAPTISITETQLGTPNTAATVTISFNTGLSGNPPNGGVYGVDTETGIGYNSTPGAEGNWIFDGGSAAGGSVSGHTVALGPGQTAPTVDTSGLTMDDGMGGSTSWDGSGSVSFTDGGSGTPEIQDISLTDLPTIGTFTITGFFGTSSALNPGMMSGDFLGAINAAVGSGNVSVNQLSSTEWTLTWTSNGPQALVTGTNINLGKASSGSDISDSGETDGVSPGVPNVTEIQNGHA